MRHILAQFIQIAANQFGWHVLSVTEAEHGVLVSAKYLKGFTHETSLHPCLIRYPMFLSNFVVLLHVKLADVLHHERDFEITF